MPHPDEPSLVEYVAENSSATALAVYGASDPVAAAAALRIAAADILDIRSPYEPDDPLPNWCAVLDEDGVPVLHLDMKDEIRYAALVVRIILDRLAEAGVGGRLSPRRPPDPVFAYDGAADLHSGMTELRELDDRGLPPGFPEGFPVPEDAVLVMAQRQRDGAAEHVAWRRSEGPFTGYLDRLSDYGCMFGVVPRSLTFDRAPDMVKYTLWRAGGGGSVTLFAAKTWPRHWYASVVWHPSAEPPPAPVRPDERPDTRPVPSGPAAARAVTEFLVPAPLVLGCEALIAVTIAADHLRDLLEKAPDRRPGPVVVASRLAPVFEGLAEPRMSAVRHTCLTLFANLMATGRRGRPAGLTLVPDEDGLLHAADVRERAREVLDPGVLPAFEAGLALVKVGPEVGGPLTEIRDAPVPPPAERYAWLFAGLEPELLAVTRDACWQIAGAPDDR